MSVGVTVDVVHHLSLVEMVFGFLPLSYAATVLPSLAGLVSDSPLVAPPQLKQNSRHLLLCF
jgi:hypothetical protein